MRQLPAPHHLNTVPAPTPTPPRPRVLVTRAPEQGSELADYLRTLGADPILVPAIELAPPTSYFALDTALKNLGSYHWLLFTSANAAEAFGRRTNRVPPSSTVSPSKGGVLPPTSQDTPEPAIPKIAAIGPATARALQKLGLTPDLIPPKAVAESLTESLLPHVNQPGGRPTRFLLIRAEEARELLPETLRAAGAEVTVAPAYRTIVPGSSVDLLRLFFHPAVAPLHQPTIQAITFTSSSTARNLLALCEAAGVALPEDALRISIGPITTRTLVDMGLPPHAEAAEATVAALARATMEALTNKAGARL